MLITLPTVWDNLSVRFNVPSADITPRNIISMIGSTVHVLLPCGLSHYRPSHTLTKKENELFIMEHAMQLQEQMSFAEYKSLRYSSVTLARTARLLSRKIEDEVDSIPLYSEKSPPTLAQHNSVVPIVFSPIERNEFYAPDGEFRSDEDVVRKETFDLNLASQRLSQLEQIDLTLLSHLVSLQQLFSETQDRLVDCRLKTIKAKESVLLRTAVLTARNRRMSDQFTHSEERVAIAEAEAGLAPSKSQEDIYAQIRSQRDKACLDEPVVDDDTLIVGDRFDPLCQEFYHMHEGIKFLGTQKFPVSDGSWPYKRTPPTFGPKFTSSCWHRSSLPEEWSVGKSGPHPSLPTVASVQTTDVLIQKRAADVKADLATVINEARLDDRLKGLRTRIREPSMITHDILIHSIRQYHFTTSVAPRSDFATQDAFIYFRNEDRLATKACFRSEFTVAAIGQVLDGCRRDLENSKKKLMSVSEKARAKMQLYISAYNDHRWRVKKLQMAREIYQVCCTTVTDFDNIEDGMEIVDDTEAIEKELTLMTNVAATFTAVITAENHSRALLEHLISTPSGPAYRKSKITKVVDNMSVIADLEDAASVAIQSLRTYTSYRDGNTNLDVPLYITTPQVYRFAIERNLRDGDSKSAAIANRTDGTHTWAIKFPDYFAGYYDSKFPEVFRGVIGPSNDYRMHSHIFHDIFSQASNSTIYICRMFFERLTNYEVMQFITLFIPTSVNVVMVNSAEEYYSSVEEENKVDDLRHPEDIPDDMFRAQPSLLAPGGQDLMSPMGSARENKRFRRGYLRPIGDQPRPQKFYRYSDSKYGIPQSGDMYPSGEDKCIAASSTSSVKYVTGEDLILINTPVTLSETSQTQLFTVNPSYTHLGRSEPDVRESDNEESVIDNPHSPAAADLSSSHLVTDDEFYFAYVDLGLLTAHERHMVELLKNTTEFLFDWFMARGITVTVSSIDTLRLHYSRDGIERILFDRRLQELLWTASTLDGYVSEASSTK